MWRCHQKQERNFSQREAGSCLPVDGRENAAPVYGTFILFAPDRADEEEESDLLLLGCGAFSPLKGFLTREDYYSVLHRCRLADGRLGRYRSS